MQFRRRFHLGVDPDKNFLGYVMEKHSLGDLNDNGRWFVELRSFHRPVIGGRLFKQRVQRE